MSTERPGDTRPVDDAVDQAWREASTEGPSARIDAAILEAARAEVARKPAAKVAPISRGRRDWWTRWQPLAAAATVAGFAFILVQKIPRDREVAPPIAIEMSRQQAPTGAPSTAPSAAPAVKSNEATLPSTAAAPAAAEAAAESSAPSGVAAETDAAAGARYRAAAPMASTAAAPAPPLAPGDWAARIESLYDAGDLEDAAAELQAFRAEYEDADRHLPEALREWAASVR